MKSSQIPNNTVKEIKKAASASELISLLNDLILAQERVKKIRHFMFEDINLFEVKTV